MPGNGGVAVKALLGIGVVASAIVLTLAGWLSLYPGRTDPKSMSYVLWKHELYKLDVPDAAAAMIGDPHREALVLGKSQKELERRFGHLLSLSEVPPRLKGCYHEYGEEPGTEVRFIAESDWMVVFSKDRAAKLVLLKSC